MSASLSNPLLPSPRTGEVTASQTVSRVQQNPAQRLRGRDVSIAVHANLLPAPVPVSAIPKQTTTRISASIKTQSDFKNISPGALALLSLKPQRVLAPKKEYSSIIKFHLEKWVSLGKNKPYEIIITDRAIFLSELAESGFLEILQILQKEFPDDFRKTLLESKALFNTINIDGDALLLRDGEYEVLEQPFNMNKIDECCLFLLKCGACPDQSRIVYFIENKCFKTAGFLIKRIDPSSNVFLMTIRALIFEDKYFNPEIFFKTLASMPQSLGPTGLSKIIEATYLSESVIPDIGEIRFLEIKKQFLHSLMQIGWPSLRTIADKQAFLMNMISRGRIEILRALHSAHKGEFTDFLIKEANLIDNIDFTIIHPDASIKDIDECCQLLVSIGARFNISEIDKFLLNECFLTAKAILNKLGPYKNIYCDMLWVLLFPESHFNIKIFLKGFEANADWRNEKNLFLILNGIIFAANVLPQKYSELFLNRQRTFIQGLLLLGINTTKKGVRDLSIFQKIVSVVNLVEKNQTIINRTKNLLIELLLPFYVSEPSVGHILLKNPDYQTSETIPSALVSQLTKYIEFGGDVNAVDKTTGNSFMYGIVKRDLVDLSAALSQHKKLKHNLSNLIFQAFYCSKNPEAALKMLYASLNDEGFRKEFQPNLHECLEAIFAIPFKDGKNLQHVMDLVKMLAQLSKDKTNYPKHIKYKQTGNWDQSENFGLPPFVVLFQNPCLTESQKLMRDNIVLFLLTQPGHDIFLAESLANTQGCLTNYRSYTKTIRVFNQSLPKDTQLRLLRIEEMAREEAMFFQQENFLLTSKPNDDGHDVSLLTLREDQTLSKIHLLLSKVLDSATDIPVPENMPPMRRDWMFLSSVKHWHRFRKLALQRNDRIHDDLYKKLLSEKEFAMSLFNDLDQMNWDHEIDEIMRKLTELPVYNMGNPQITGGLSSGCLLIPGAYYHNNVRKNVFEYVIEKNMNHTFNFTIINTGEGAPIFSDSSGKNYTQDLVYQSLTCEQLSPGFFKMLLEYMTGGRTAQSMDEIYKVLHAHLGRGKRAFGRKHSLQHSMMNGVGKSDSSFDKRRLTSLTNPSFPLALGYKSFYTDEIIREFNEVVRQIQDGDPRNYPRLLGLFGNNRGLLINWLNALGNRAAIVAQKRNHKFLTAQGMHDKVPLASGISHIPQQSISKSKRRIWPRRR